MTIRFDREQIINRVYLNIKFQVVNCEFPPGEKLRIDDLAESLRVSATPVREALNRLVAENLIVLIPNIGFFMKRLSVSEVRDLYELNQILLAWSVNSTRVTGRKVPDENWKCAELLQEQLQMGVGLSSRDLVKITGRLFESLAVRSGNDEVALRVRRINDRLNSIRLCEYNVLQGSIYQLVIMCQLSIAGRFEELIGVIKQYHKMRLLLLSELCGALKETFPKRENVSTESGR